MKRLLQGAVVCAVVLAMIAMASAQAPTPVVRMGDWVEIGDDAWMNIIGNIDLRYNFNHNQDFEDDVRDVVSTRSDPTTGVSPTSGTSADHSDNLEVEIRWGADFRYKKNLHSRIIFETQSIFDGNLIDDQNNSDEENSPHVERFWIDYRFPKTPVRVRLGADLWTTDPARLLGDDDPRAAIFLEYPTFTLSASAVIQTEAMRQGLTNDNDDVYYTFGGSYTGLKPHRLALDGGYFRFRNDQGGQKEDTVLLMPSWTGSFGPISGLLQFNVVFGEIETDTRDFDVFGWAVVGYVDFDLGIARPFLGVVYGTGDDDPNDDDLEGFSHFPDNSITLFNGGTFGFMVTTFATGSRDTQCPARGACAGGGPEQYGHTTGNAFNDLPGNEGHTGVNTAYSNPGTLHIPVGVHIFPLKGHQLTALYIYSAFTETALFEADIGPGTNIDESKYHELALIWNWTISGHLDLRLAGHAAIPGKGTKDLAETEFTCSGGTQRCEGEDVALRGEIRVRARF